MIFTQIFDMVNVGIVILDKEYHVHKWNRWMEIHSGIQSRKIEGKSLFHYFPSLNQQWFLRNCKSVLAFGNFSFFSQKLHKYLFPFKPICKTDGMFDYMQQSCTMGPLRNAANQVEFIYLMVQDVTEVAMFEKKLLNMNMTDELTQVNNRRFFEQRIREEFERHKRYDRPLSLILFDIDFFKKVNDTYGHQAGDLVLKSFANLIKSRIRSVDILARYGGEEFCCLLPETAISDAMHLAEIFRLLVKESVFNYNDTEIQVTVSMGVSELDATIENAESLLKRADDALYVAKETGRDRAINGNHHHKFGIQSSFDEKQHVGCVKCGAKLTYLEVPETRRCDMCSKPKIAVAVCESGHFICDRCQSQDTLDVIKTVCLSSKETDMITLMNELRAHPSFSMHGPDHHIAVPAVILTTFRNLGGTISDADILTGINRGQTVPGGSCGFGGVCGAALGAGIAFGIITKSNPVRPEVRGKLMEITGQVIHIPRSISAARCCLRETWTTLLKVAELSEEILPFSLKAEGSVVCGQATQNPECAGKECPFFPMQETP